MLLVRSPCHKQSQNDKNHKQVNNISHKPLLNFKYEPNFKIIISSSNKRTYRLYEISILTHNSVLMIKIIQRIVTKHKKSLFRCFRNIFKTSSCIPYIWLGRHLQTAFIFFTECASLMCYRKHFLSYYLNNFHNALKPGIKG